MTKIIKEIMGQADVVITEIYPSEEAASSNEEPENRQVKVNDFKATITKWRKHNE